MSLHDVGTGKATLLCSLAPCFASAGSALQNCPVLPQRAARTRQDLSEAEAVYGPLAALALAPDTAPRLAAVRPALLQVRGGARRQ